MVGVEGKSDGGEGEMISRSFGMFGKCDGRAGEIEGRFGGGWALVWSRTETERCRVSDG